MYHIKNTHTNKYFLKSYLCVNYTPSILLGKRKSYKNNLPTYNFSYKNILVFVFDRNNEVSGLNNWFVVVLCEP